ncbi:MAG: hypothetical protein R3C01_06135 [Planctomycetaceae bacterium]
MSKSRQKVSGAATLAATVAREDIACGDYITVLRQSIELPSYFWDRCDVGLPPTEMVRLRVVPEFSGQPLRVFAICLPFVYARNAQGFVHTLDTRRTELARLDHQAARKVWKKLLAPRPHLDPLL